MTQPVAENEPVPPAPDAEAVASEAEAGAPPAPEPEPWTPARVSEWNAYYDRYVMGAALLLGLVVACNYVNDSSLFLHLRTGQLIAERKAPVTTDEFSYTQEGRRWVDVPWLFEWSHASLYDSVYNLVPVDPLDPTANRGRADQLAIIALELLDALVRVMAAWMLLKIRHRGPGLWWSAICVTLAMGVFFHPVYGLAPGGLASVPSPSTGIMPSAWGQLFLALELLIAFRAFDQGRGRYLWWLIPLFVLWVNCDVSFLSGLLLLAGIVVGHWLDGGALAWSEREGDGAGPDGWREGAAKPTEATAARPVPISTALLVLGLCAAATLVNPWTFHVYPAALNPFAEWIWGSSSYQIPEAISFFSRNVSRYFTAFYLIIVAAGVASFVLNAARFSWRRFLAFAVVAVLWGCLVRYCVEFAMVLAVVIALNGQEWYLSQFGGEGRLGRGWTLWSTGGRVVTLLLTFAMVGIVITGYEVNNPDVHFGLGYNPDRYPMEAADFLARNEEIKGNVFNTLMGQGDLLIWKAFPKRKTYIDGRMSLFPRELLDEREEIRKAIRDEDVATWKPLLDRYNVTVLMIDPRESYNTYKRLMGGLNWIHFYDDGQVAMFGRKDAPESDLAFFKANRHVPEKVYHVANQAPPAAGPPTPVSWMDTVFQNRNLDRVQFRTHAARRWLVGGPNEGGILLPEPARCLLAIQDARIALSRKPDDPDAFRVLSDAYRWLTLQESAMLAGIPLTPENSQRILSLTPAPNPLRHRFQQSVTALNYAIQTTPAPTSEPARDELYNLNMRLFELYMSAGYVDLGRDRLKAALALNPTAERLSPEERAVRENQLSQLDEAIEQVASKMEELNIEQQPRAVDLAMFAQQQGVVGLAISKLADADASGDSPSLVKPQLLELYCDTGQPDRASDLLSVGSLGDPNLGTDPGQATYRQAMVYYLMGNYMYSASLIDRAIIELRKERSMRTMVGAKGFAHGESMMATNQFLKLPSSVEQQAVWEFDQAVCYLEGGQPADAADHFTRALTLEPDLGLRPIAAYYLEKLGKPVPPKRETAVGKAPVPTAPNATNPASNSGPPTSVPVRPAPDAASPPAAKAKAAPEPDRSRVADPEKSAEEKAPAKKADEVKAGPR